MAELQESKLAAEEEEAIPYPGSDVEVDRRHSAKKPVTLSFGAEFESWSRTNILVPSLEVVLRRRRAERGRKEHRIVLGHLA